MNKHTNYRSLLFWSATLLFCSLLVLMPLTVGAAPQQNDVNFGWVYAVGSTELDTGLKDNGNNVVVDSDGNVYVTGFFEGTIDFDPGPGEASLTARETSSIFVVKLDPQGNLIWARAMGGTGDFPGQARGHAIALDSQGNVYTTGYFTGEVDLDPGEGTALLSTFGELALFVSKLDANGNHVWAKGIDGNEKIQGMGIGVDSEGNVYTSGFFEGTIDFDPGDGQADLTSAGQEDIFISKLDKDGNYVWAKRIGANLPQQGARLQVDGANNVYLTGSFAGAVDFDPGEGTATLATPNPPTDDDSEDVFATDSFILKLDSGGNYVWAKHMGGTGYEYGTDLQVDAEGNVYATGYFQETADFDPGPGEFNLVSVGSDDAYITKLDSNGDFVWAKRFGNDLNDRGFGIALDSAGHIYTTGLFQLTVDFDPGSGVFELTGGTLGWNIFISKLDRDGNFVWATAMINRGLFGSVFAAGHDIALDGNGNVYTTGFFGGETDFDPGPANTATYIDNSENIFISKLTQSGGSTTVPDGDVQALIDAIKAANAAGAQGRSSQAAPAVIDLAANGAYTLTVVENTTNGANGLPVITGNLMLNGNGATIARSSAEGIADFRILEISGTLRLDGVTLRNGSATGEGFRDGSGGAILNLGVLTVTNSTITGNRADRDGGGIASVAFDQNAYLEIDSSRVLSNTAGRNGGGSSSHANDHRTAILVVRHSEIAGNQVPSESFVLFSGFGGGIYSGDVDDEFGSGGQGATGIVTITHSSVHHNKATEAGGGIANVLDGNSHIEMAVISSAVYSNSVRADGNDVGNGGGLANIDAVLTLQNSTVSGNEAAGFGITKSGNGGGVYNAARFRNATFTALNSTIAYNEAIREGGGVAYSFPDSSRPVTPTTTLRNSIVSNNVEALFDDENCGSGDFVPVENGILSLGNNIEDKNTCGFNQPGDLPNTNPMLEPLAPNTAPGQNAAFHTWTHALPAGSPAIDAANSPACPPTDQRGVARPVGSGCDIGAFEAHLTLQYLYLPLTQR